MGVIDHGMVIEIEPDGMTSIVATVLRAAREECAPGECPIDPVLEMCAYDAVATLWESRVKTYLPLLALRTVRCCIRAGTCDCGVC